MSKHLPAHRRNLVLLTGGSALAAASAFAQTSPPPDAGPPRAAQLAPVIVTGNPLGSTDMAAPVSVLAGDELVLRRGSSLGETLAGQPGVSSTSFGPNASRPIIRGFDGDRIRILANGGASFDASTLSFDHAVPIDPLTVERIEVLRGPGALLYGGSAIGGVINAIDNRIPKYSLSGVSGAAELRFGGADRERGSSALVEAGNGDFALHLDGFQRQTSDQRVPDYTPIDAEGNVLDRTRRVRNSASRADGGALGGSYTFGSGYLGASADTYDNHYGVTAEEGVIIKMKRDRYALAGELRDLAGPLRKLRLQLSDSSYRHDEIEAGGAIGTTFRTLGRELRVEAEHAPIGPLKGVIGAQIESFDFSALGEEAFVPTTTTRRRALFLVEEWATPVGTLSGGLRAEQARIASDGDAAGSGDERFGPAQRRSYGLRSGSIGDVYKLTDEWSLSGTYSSTARAPTSFELYANGVHAATGAFERGDPTLGIERGNNVDLALQWKRGASKARIGVFDARFLRYISLEATGTQVVVPGEGEGQTQSIPEYTFRPVRARFRGVEFEAAHRLLDGGWSLDVSGKIDYTRATNVNTGQALPRIAPLRATLGFDARTGPWLARIEVDHADRQGRVPSYDSSTAGYTMLNLAFTRRTTLWASDALLFVKVNNLTDRLAYSASTIETIRALAPMTGRSVKAGVRVAF